MIIAIAWKNIWRNKVRSLTVITAVMLGLWAGSFLMAYAFGIMEQRLADAIENEISHIQIHHPDFPTDNDPEYQISNSEEVLAQLKQDSSVKAVSSRVLVMAMINSPTSSAGVKLLGVSPEDEDELTGIGGLVQEGSFLDDGDKNKVVIGAKLAKKLKVKIRSKIVLTFQDADQNIVAGAFRVKGIYKSYNSAIEELNIYTHDQDIRKLLGGEATAHEIALLIHDSNQLSEVQSSLSADNPTLLVQSWKELSPELNLMIETMDQSMIIFLVILLIALSFGIVNTMLMAVLERVKEIGMLMAIGMNKVRLFSMIALETIMMVMIAVPFGLLFAYLTIEYLGVEGLNLSGLYGEGYAQYGFKSIIYPSLSADYYFQIVMLVLITAILSSIYPAITALRLDPIAAIRKI